MGSGIYIATSGAVAQSKSLDVIANNVSNSATPGFKAQRAVFREQLIDAQTKEMSSVRVDAAEADFSPGVLKHTGRDLDLALEGDGYFAIDTPRGVRYTRAGEFRLDATGTLVNSVGFAARSLAGGRITVPPETQRTNVDKEGRVFADGEEIGQLELAKFRNAAMKKEGSNMFSVADGERAVDELPEVLSGAIEKSNVNVVHGVVEMVRVSRTYQALMRMIEAYQQIDSRTARSLGSGR